MLPALRSGIRHLFQEIISEPFHTNQQQSDYMLKPALQQVIRSGEIECQVHPPWPESAIELYRSIDRRS
jgi:hypothetical protein